MSTHVSNSLIHRVNTEKRFLLWGLARNYRHTESSLLELRSQCWISSHSTWGGSGPLLAERSIILKFIKAWCKKAWLSTTTHMVGSWQFSGGAASLCRPVSQAVITADFELLLLLLLLLQSHAEGLQPPKLSHKVSIIQLQRGPQSKQECFVHQVKEPLETDPQSQHLNF